MSLSASDLGVDDRAQELLETLTADKQQAILQKLSDGLDEGKVRNASAYVASACTKPDALGLDERAAALLNQLPKPRRKEVLDKLKNTDGVKNPSAWVAKACLKDAAVAAPPPHQYQQSWHPDPWQQPGKGDYGKGGYGVVVKGAYGKGGYDAYGGYGAYDAYSGYGKDGYGKGGYGTYVPYSVPSYSKGKGGGKGGADTHLDASASRLLQSLPAEDRKEIMAKLRNETGIRNPSAWVAKAALKAGANPQHTPMDGVPDLDAEAQELLDSLPLEEQETIREKLKEDSSIRNPSAWVAKAAISAGATPTRPKQSGPRGGLRQTLDVQAKQLLETLAKDQQDDILAKLEENMAAGQVRNPSGWVVKASLNAGAKPLEQAGGAPPASKGKGKGKRFSPY